MKKYYIKLKEDVLAKVFKFFISLFCFAIFFGLGWYSGSEESGEMKRQLVGVVDSNKQFYKLEAKVKLDMLFALKEGRVGLVEKSLAGSLKQTFKYPMYSNVKYKDEFISNLIDRAILFQDKYCDNLCLGASSLDDARRNQEQ